MSMFGNLVGDLMGKQGGASLMGVVSRLIERAGGVQGLLAILQKGGLGEQIQSWIGKGANLPVSGNALGQALSAGGLGGVLQEEAGKLGISEGAMNDKLAQLLPEAVNHLTPEGSASSGHLDLSSLSGLAGKLFG